MGKDLTNSQIERQNILNNKYAFQEIQNAVVIHGFIYNDDFIKALLAFIEYETKEN